MRLAVHPRASEHRSGIPARLSAKPPLTVPLPPQWQYEAASMSRLASAAQRSMRHHRKPKASGDWSVPESSKVRQGIHSFAAGTRAMPLFAARQPRRAAALACTAARAQCLHPAGSAWPFGLASRCAVHVSALCAVLFGSPRFSCRARSHRAAS